MYFRDFFPLGIATGKAFCNRTQETQLLFDNIKHGKHTLLMATRRYGKSSLALHALKLSNVAYIETDFYMARNEKTIELYILNAVINLIENALGSIEKLVVLIKKYVKNLNPKLVIGTTSLKLELNSNPDTDPATNVKEALMLLERLLAEKNKHAVLLFDEFQNVGVIAQGKGIEGAIRHVAQKTKYLTFIFSGSNRHLLKNMFEDETRPLYKLCWKLNLERIAADEYEKHLQIAANITWKKELDNDVITKILLLTERHPYYVNKLCDRLWIFNNIPPTIENVIGEWQQIISEEKSEAIKEISQLSLGQKSVLLQIAKSTEQLTSKKAMLTTKMSSSSIATAITGLVEKDIIEKDNLPYHIINPVIKYYVLKNESA